MGEIDIQRTVDVRSRFVFNTGMTITSTTTTVGERLRRARRGAHLQGSELARRLEVAPETLSRYENGHSIPPKLVLYGYAYETEMPLDWLQTGAVADDVTHGDFEKWENQLSMFDDDQDFTNQLPRPDLSYLSVR